jgi:polysaccharide biosynthesis protein PslG
MKRAYGKAKSHSKNSRKYLLIAVFLTLLIVVGLEIKRSFFTPVSTFVHGPHLSKTLYASGLSQQNVLGTKSNRINFRLRKTPTPALQKLATIIPTPTQSISIKQNQFGVSAGGNIPHLNQAELDTYFSQLKELGVSWMRSEFDWGTIQEESASIYNWTDTDRVVQTANKYGIHILGAINYTPAWAQASECRGTFACAPADPNAFGTFAGQVAARYAPLGIHYWEIWNEPNIADFWKPAPDVISYVAILKSAYASIKKTDSSALILSGGLSPAGDENNNISPTTFMQALYEIDTTKDFDGIAFHPYSYPVIASYPASWNSWQQMDAIRQIMSAHGDGNKQIWLTEYGAPTGGRGTPHETTNLDFVYGQDYMSENAQADIMRDALMTYSKLSGPIGPIFWYSLKDNGTDKSTPENFFGLLRFDGTKKPAYSVFQSAIASSK